MLRLMLLFVTIPTLALAQVPSNTEVVIPWGDWVLAGMNVLLPTALTVLSGVATYVIGKYMPPWMRAFAGDAAQRRVNQVLEKAVLSAVAQTKGAIAGKRLTLPVGIEVLRKAAQYAVDQAPELMNHAAKDQVDNLLKMLLARMEQLGVAPENLDVDAAKKKTDFDFRNEISRQMGK